MRWWLLILCGVMAYLSFLLAGMPSQYINNLLSSGNLPISLEQSSGSVWHGEANQARYKSVGLGPVKWQFDVLGLLKGRIQFRLILDGTDQDLSGYVAKDMLTGTLCLSQIRGMLAVDRLLRLYDQTAISANGELELDLQELRISHRQILSAQGEVRWLDARVQQPINAELGNLQFTLVGDENGLESHIKDLSGPIRVDGKIFLLPDGSYRLQGKLASTDASSRNLLSQLQSIGRPLADGSIQIDYGGRY